MPQLAILQQILAPFQGTMEPMKMAQRPNLQALPNIHSTTSAKLPEFSDTTPTQSQSFRHRSSRSSFPSAKSVDSTIRYNHTVTAGSMPATLDSLLPDVGDEEQIDFGRIRIERKSHKSLLPPSVSGIIIDGSFDTN